MLSVSCARDFKFAACLTSPHGSQKMLNNLFANMSQLQNDVHECQKKISHILTLSHRFSQTVLQDCFQLPLAMVQTCPNIGIRIKHNIRIYQNDSECRMGMHGEDMIG